MWVSKRPQNEKATHLHFLTAAQERPAETGLTQDACQVGGQRAQREAPQECWQTAPEGFPRRHVDDRVNFHQQIAQQVQRMQVKAALDGHLQSSAGMLSTRCCACRTTPVRCAMFEQTQSISALLLLECSQAGQPIGHRTGSILQVVIQKAQGTSCL